jgi:hypothetical protein
VGTAAIQALIPDSRLPKAWLVAAAVVQATITILATIPAVQVQPVKVTVVVQERLLLVAAVVPVLAALQ